MKKRFDLNAPKPALAKKLLAGLCLALAIVFLVLGLVKLGQTEKTYAFVGAELFTREAEDAPDGEEEDYEDNILIPVRFVSESGDYELTLEYIYQAEIDEADTFLGGLKAGVQRVSDRAESFILSFTKKGVTRLEDLPEDACVTGYIYESADGDVLVFDHEAADRELSAAARDEAADGDSMYFSAAMALFLAGVAFCVIGFFGKHFTNYEQLWFISFMVVTAIASILLPEESANGVNGLVIMALYLADTFLNLLCELLISKQSKWNFIVSVLVEITEIAICLVLMYRFATMVTTLLFWLPVDIVSFVNWHRHPDRQKEELTVVRTLKGWQEAAIIAGIVLWTAGVGYFLTTLDLGSDFFRNRTLEVAVCYMDACASAVGIVNGLFILFRLREQWIAWYIEAALEGIINVLSGQFILLILKIGYFTNTTYGYIKWTKYIRAHEEAAEPQAIGNRQ